MILDYIYHSGFALEAEGVTVIIDYYKDSSEAEHSRGIVHDYLLQKPGKLYVLATHFHPDHFNREILTWKEQRPDIHYIFSKDILKSHRAQAEDAIYIKKGDAPHRCFRFDGCGQFILDSPARLECFPCRRFKQLALERRIYRRRDTKSKRRFPCRS